MLWVGIVVLFIYDYCLSELPQVTLTLHLGLPAECGEGPALVLKVKRRRNRRQQMKRRSHPLYEWW